MIKFHVNPYKIPKSPSGNRFLEQAEYWGIKLLRLILASLVHIFSTAFISTITSKLFKYNIFIFVLSNALSLLLSYRILFPPDDELPSKVSHEYEKISNEADCEVSHHSIASGQKQNKHEIISNENNNYTLRFMKLIPSDALAIYLSGAGFIQKEQVALLTVWAIIGLLALIFARLAAARRSKESPQWLPIRISSIYYVLWLYAIGGPFEAFSMYIPYSPQVGALLMTLWTFAVPALYLGEPNEDEENL